MSNPVYKTTQTTTTTTSSIHEFICLFTHDLKRKTKRWQDGRLKYHAFNGRIMVYDDRGGSVGDAHLTASQTLDEGEEITLDRGGAIVQVCERVGEKEVDLGKLVDRRAREVEKRRKEASAKQQKARPQASGGGGDAAMGYPPQRPLSAIMQTPGRIGRAAIPKESPFERRMMREAKENGTNGDTPPAAKRRRIEDDSPRGKSVHARALFGTQISLCGGPSSWRSSQALRDRTNVRIPTSSAEKGEEDVVVIDNDESHRTKQDVSLSSQTKNLGVPVEPAKSRQNASSIMRDESSKSRLGGLRISRVDTSTIPRTHDHIPTHVPLESHAPKSPISREIPPTTAIITIDSSTEDPPAQRLALSKAVRRKPPPLLQSIRKNTPLNGTIEDSNTTPPLDENADEPEEPPPRKKPKAPVRTKSTTQSARVSSQYLDIDRTGGTTRCKKSSEKAANASKGDTQPRTELRIRSRKKRGLLMLSEQTAPAPKEAQSSNVCTSGCDALSREPSVAPPEPEDDNDDAFEAWYAKSLGNRETQSPKAASPQPSALRVEDEDAAEYVKDTNDAAMADPEITPTDSSSFAKQEDTAKDIEQHKKKAEEENELPKSSGGKALVTSSRVTRLAERRCSPKRRKSVTEEYILSGSEDSSESDEPSKAPTRKQRSTKASTAEAPPSTIPHFSEDSESDNDWDGPEAPVPKTRTAQTKPKPRPVANKKRNAAPRISRISKSSKSKEIFGFKLPVDNSVTPNPFTSTTSRVEWAETTPIAASVIIETDSAVQPRPSGVSTMARVTDSTVVEKSCEDVQTSLTRTNAVSPRVVEGNAEGSMDHDQPIEAQKSSEQRAQAEPASSAILTNKEDQQIPQKESEEPDRALDVKPPSVEDTPAGSDGQDDGGKPPNPPAEIPNNASGPNIAKEVVKPVTKRLANPATRGRKAASKADAAGRAPQILVPFETAPQVIGRPRPVETRPAAKEPVPMPGWCKANGGAWSRHAQDLLGIGRPT